MLTTSEENYLKTIFSLSNFGQLSVHTNTLADALQTKAASVSEMIKKLSVKKLIRYKKYYGVQLTSKGEQLATRIIRKHRIWETFLVHSLGYRWDEVHEVAEQLEHIQSDTLINRLDKFLHYPTNDPHGDPIPTHNLTWATQPSRTLYTMKENEVGIIQAVDDKSAKVLRWCEKNQLTPGNSIRIAKSTPAQTEILHGKKKIIVSKNIAHQIKIK